MFRKIIIAVLILFVLLNCAGAADSSDWPTVKVGDETFKIPPEYAENPDTVTAEMYEWDYDIDEFTIRHATPSIMELYGYYMEKYPSKKVNVSGHDAVHFHYYDRHDEKNNSVLWFSSGEEFYFIYFRGDTITPTVKEVVKSCSESEYSHDEFYSILNEEYKNYKIVNAIESIKVDYPIQSKGFTYGSFGSNGFSVGVGRYY